MALTELKIDVKGLDEFKQLVDALVFLGKFVEQTEEILLNECTYTLYEEIILNTEKVMKDKECSVKTFKQLKELLDRNTK